MSGHTAFRNWSTFGPLSSVALAVKYPSVGMIDPMPSRSPRWMLIPVSRSKRGTCWLKRPKEGVCWSILGLGAKMAMRAGVVLHRGSNNIRYEIFRFSLVWPVGIFVPYEVRKWEQYWCRMVGNITFFDVIFLPGLGNRLLRFWMFLSARGSRDWRIPLKGWGGAIAIIYVTLHRGPASEGFQLLVCKWDFGKSLIFWWLWSRFWCLLSARDGRSGWNPVKGWNESCAKYIVALRHGPAIEGGLPVVLGQEFVEVLAQKAKIGGIKCWGKLKLLSYSYYTLLSPPPRPLFLSIVLVGWVVFVNPRSFLILISWTSYICMRELFSGSNYLCSSAEL